MRPRSLRARLAGWYLMLLLTASVAVALGSWLLLGRSVLAAADAHLVARVHGVQSFAESAIALPHEDLLDEFHEYAELTPGDSLLDVRDDRGQIYCQPTLSGWHTMVASAPVLEGVGSPRLETRRINGQPYRVVFAAFRVRDQGFTMTAATPLAAPLGIVSTFGWALIGLVPVVVIAAAAGGYL